MDILIRALQFFACLSLLVVLHEAGHFGFSKLFGVKVEKFYMFFNPKFHLFSTRDKWFTRLFPYFKTNETEYGIGWIPLGGYVKIAGMVDESMDLEQLKQPAQPNEFRSQKVWKRFLIMFGGVLMNFLTAWFVFSAMLWVWGKDYQPMTSISEGLEFNATAQELGFQNKDLIVAIDGEAIEAYSPSLLLREICLAEKVTVIRDGQEVDIQLPADGLSLLTLFKQRPPFFSLYAPAVIDSIIPGSAADLAGITPGSRLIQVNGYYVDTWSDFDQQVTLRCQDVLSAPDCTTDDSLRMKDMQVVVLRSDGTLDTLSLTLSDDYKMGVIRKLPSYKTEHKSYNFLSSIPAGLLLGWEQLTTYVSDLRYMASAEGAKNVGSFVTIGSLFPTTWDWQLFWSLTAFLSIMLAVMNILPIPGLDGGHILLLFYEGITGRQPSDRFMEWAEKVGIGLILLLMLLAISNDFRNIVLPLLGL